MTEEIASSETAPGQVAAIPEAEKDLANETQKHIEKGSEEGLTSANPKKDELPSDANEDQDKTDEDTTQLEKENKSKDASSAAPTSPMDTDQPVNDKASDAPDTKQDPSSQNESGHPSSEDAQVELTDPDETVVADTHGDERMDVVKDAQKDDEDVTLPDVSADKENVKKEIQVKKIDRSQTIPFCIRIFVRMGEHSKEKDFLDGLPKGEINLHCWKDTTLREIVALLSLHRQEALNSNVRFSFRQVSRRQLADKKFVTRDLGIVSNSRKLTEESKTLAESWFRIGDYMDIAILEEGKNGSVTTVPERRVFRTTELSSNRGRTNRFAPYQSKRPAMDRRSGIDAEKW